MNLIDIDYFKTEFGELILGSFENKLCLCDWRHRKMRNLIDARIQKELNATYHLSDSEIIKQTKKQLIEYFNHERLIFDIPLRLAGTVFQQTVWKELMKIPFGKTETYLGLSKKLNHEKGIRAVASANGANAISIIIPCHRIIGKNGNLVGYAGGINTKKKLLQLESPNYNDTQLKIFT